MNNLAYQIAHNKYGSYCVPLNSAYTITSQAIIAGKIHEPSTIDFILKNSGDGDIIHAGAGFGDFFPALSTLKNKTIWSFEPNTENFKCAKKIIEKDSPIIALEIHSEALKYNSFMEKIHYFPIKHLIYDSGPMVFINTVYKKCSDISHTKV